MSTAIARVTNASASTADDGPPTARVTFGGVVRSEWIKFRTLPSTWWTMAFAVGSMIVFGGVIGSITGDDVTADPGDMTPSAMMRGYYISQLLVGVMGVLIVSSEYSTGMIRASLAAVPRRASVLGAKVLVFTTIGLIVMTAASFGAFVSSQVFIDSAYQIDLGDEGVWQAVVGTGVYLTVVGLLGGALGWILRSTPGAISALVGLMLVAPLVLQVIPSDLSSDLARLLPSELGVSLSSAGVANPNALSTGAALIGMAAWLIVGFAAALATLRTRDA